MGLWPGQMSSYFRFNFARSLSRTWWKPLPGWTCPKTGSTSSFREADSARPRFLHSLRRIRLLTNGSLGMRPRGAGGGTQTVAGLLLCVVQTEGSRPVEVLQAAGLLEASVPDPQFQVAITGLMTSAIHTIGRPGGVGGQLSGVVLGVGGATAARLAGMDLDQATPVADAHQLETQADLHLLPGRARGGRYQAEGLLADHAVVGMNFRGAPVGDFVGLAVPASQGVTPGGAPGPSR